MSDQKRDGRVKPCSLILNGDGGIWRLETEFFPGTFLLDEMGQLWKLQSYVMAENIARYMPAQESLLVVDRTKVVG